MVNWSNVLSKPVGRTAIINFANGGLNCEEVQQVFRASNDRELSGQVRNLIRTKGTAEARRTARRALKRRNLI